LAGLVGAAEDTPIEEIADMVEESTWLIFEASTEWFYQVAWDLGVAALRGDRQTVVVLAATDED
jgi:hypothetical protein